MLSVRLIFTTSPLLNISRVALHQACPSRRFKEVKAKADGVGGGGGGEKTKQKSPLTHPSDKVEYKSAPKAQSGMQYDQDFKLSSYIPPFSYILVDPIRSYSRGGGGAWSA